MLGSILGGRWSDQAQRRLTDANDGHRLPEACSPPTAVLKATLMNG